MPHLPLLSQRLGIVYHFLILKCAYFWRKESKKTVLQQEKGLIALKEQEHVLKSKNFRLNVHGTKGRCELCTRVGESLYSALFSVGVISCC